MYVNTQRHYSTLVVTIARPTALNALNGEVLEGLGAVLQEAYQNEDVKGIIITGEGEKAFVAGADIKELSALVSEEQAIEMSQKGQRVFNMIMDCPKPIIAAINGFALGGGCELAMACHIRIAVESAKLGQPEINLGIIPGYGGTQRLAQLTGRAKAMELILTGDLISANEALAIGLVNKVVNTHAELMEAATTMMEKIVSKSSFAVSRAIQSINAGYALEKSGYLSEAENFAACVTTEDFKEGTTAFIEKRKPVFKGK